MKRFIMALLGLFVGLGLFAAGLVAIAIFITYPKLPSLDALTNYQPKMPLIVYSSDGVILGQFGEERRAFTRIEDFPVVLKNAVIAAEDKRFYEHSGVDFMGIVRALVSNLTGGVKSGASTITQQVARNFYLSNERTYTRKFHEALLAYKIEQSLSKDQILELYFNQIYLGQRAYGFTAAARVYFNKPVADLDLAEASILAGLPKAPSTFNPVVNPKRAKLRQRYILNNMVALQMITPAQRDAALAEQLKFEKPRNQVDPNALYVAEMVRQQMYDKYGEEAYTRGWRVYTTVRSGDQAAATAALRKALLAYDGNAKYRGAEDFLDLSAIASDELEEHLEQYLGDYHTIEGMLPAVVVSFKNNSLRAYTVGIGYVDITGASYQWVKSAINNDKMGARAVKVGSVIYLSPAQKGYRVVQQPELQGALVALDSRTGALRALVGGFDFYRKSFNRATQAERQPGSSFKPFIYSAALSRGVTPATLVNDEPLEIVDKSVKGGVWRPKNSDGRYDGFISMRDALIASKNMVSIRLLMAIGVDYARDYAKRFGFRDNQIPRGLAMALGAGTVTPVQMADAYAVFANGGYKVTPYIIDKIYDADGVLRAQTQPLLARGTAPRVIDPRNAFIMTNILKDVVNRGTATRAKVLGRSDIAGKTGTTNENKDAWFVGYNPNTVAAVYIGFDKPKSMGRTAFGGTLALPVWVDYMRYALKGQPDVNVGVPRGVVRRDGEFFLSEFPDTNPELPLEKPENLDENLPSFEGHGTGVLDSLL